MRAQIRPLQHANPQVQPHHIQTVPTPSHRVTALSQSNGSPPNLPTISSVKDWAHLMHTHTLTAFAALANKYTNTTCPIVLDCSAAGPITPDTIQHYVHGNWQGTHQVQDCLIGIFRTLGIDPSISLLQQQEIDQMLRLGEAPHRWTRPHHFSPHASYEEPSAIPICRGPWHDGFNNFLTF